MNILQMKYIVTILEEKSISAAARKLYVSQPYLSHMLRSVEKELGVELLDRKASGVEPTFAGETFCQQASAILIQYQNMLASMKDISGSIRGRLTIGIPANRALYILPSLLACMKKAYPQVEVVTLENTRTVLENWALDGKLDLLFSHYYKSNPDLEYLPIVEEEWLLAAALEHPLARQAQGIPNWKLRPCLDLKALKDESFILLRQGHGVRTFTDQLFQSNGICPPVAMETDSNPVAHALAVSGMGLTILPENEICFRSPLRHGAYFSIAQRQYHRQLCLAYPSKHYLTVLAQRAIPIICNLVKDIYAEFDYNSLMDSQ